LPWCCVSFHLYNQWPRRARTYEKGQYQEPPDFDEDWMEDDDEEEEETIVSFSPVNFPLICLSNGTDPFLLPKFVVMNEIKFGDGTLPRPGYSLPRRKARRPLHQDTTTTSLVTENRFACFQEDEEEEEEEVVFENR